MNRNLTLGGLAVLVVVAGWFAYATFGRGTLIVEMKDPPRDWGPASRVYIRYGAVEIHRANAGNESGWFTAVEGDSWIDLTTVLNSSESIGSAGLQAGKYNLMRFEVLEAVVTVGGANYTAAVSSGRITIAITEGGVEIAVGRTSHVVIDVTPKVVGSPSSGFRVVPAAKAFPA